MRASILISGIGIAGPTLAYWLNRYGLKAALTEQSPVLRGGGYVIDFWGLGYDIAERMNLLPDLGRAGYHMQQLRIVDGRSRRIAGFGTRVFRELTGGRYITLARSDLARLLFEKVRASNEIMFGDEVIALQEDPKGVNAAFASGRERRFDLVIGADGLHSGTRRLVFGPQDRFERPLGYTVAAFEAAGYRPREDLVYVIYSKPGRMIARFALKDDRTLFLAVFTGTGAVPDKLALQKAILRKTFAADGWECAAILAELDRAEKLYFDRVSQIHMESWSSGRTALIGDAAFCVSLLAGQGAALAMISAYVLAGELAKAKGDYAQAFRRYESLLRPFILKKQAAARMFAGSFAPKTQFGIFMRNQVLKALRIPGLSRWTVGRGISDNLKLPPY